MVRPLIFLDVDGVLNCPDTWKIKELAEGMGSKVVCPVMIARFEKLVEELDATIVMSSTWRKFPDHMEHLLSRSSIGKRLHSDWRTESFPARLGDKRSGRGEEIAAWLERHPEETNWAIVDDDSWDILKDQLDRFVKTSWDSGLTEEKAAELREILTRKE